MTDAPTVSTYEKPVVNSQPAPVDPAPVARSKSEANDIDQKLNEQPVKDAESK